MWEVWYNRLVLLVVVVGGWWLVVACIGYGRSREGWRKPRAPLMTWSVSVFVIHFCIMLPRCPPFHYSIPPPMPPYSYEYLSYLALGPNFRVVQWFANPFWQRPPLRLF